MYLRPKTTRRLLILGVVMALFIAVGGGMWVVNKRKSGERIAKARADAMAAFARDDYAGALPSFNEYLTASKTAEKAPGEADAEALLAYGKSRKAISMPRGRHIIESIKIFERYLQLKPGDREAQHLLLELYPRVRYNEEALNLAKIVLDADPKDPAALRARVTAYANQNKLKDALAAAEQLIAVLPNDLDAHAFRQSLMVDLQHPAEQVVRQYTDLLNQHPDDPRFELLLARAHHFNNEPESAKKWLRIAAARKTEDPVVARTLTALLEQYTMFSESNAVLERLAASTDDAVHVRPLVRRLWQGGRDKDVLKRTDDQDPASPTSDTDLLAYRALALHDLNRPADAAPIVDALAARKDDMSAVAWATALRARENENLAPRERARRYQDALERAPNNEVIHFFLGEAYGALGESEPALQAWQQAARLAPSWSAPAAAIARTLAATGRSAEALQAATEAYRRAPNAVSTTTGYVVAWFADQQQNPSPAEQKRLLELVEKIQAQLPREPETLHIYAALLSRTGQRERAAEVIKSALAADPAPPRDTLLALAGVSFTEKLGLERAVLDAAERAYGLTPHVAVRKAVLLSEAGKPREGLKLLEDARQKDATADPTQWALAVVQYREKIGDEGVLAEWVRLGDANADNALVQSAILRSSARFGDKAFWLRSIDRLQKLTGDEAVTPRVERARWLLSGETSEKNANQAILLLQAVDKAVITPLPEIHRLLGLALEKNASSTNDATNRVNLLTTAAEHLEKAFGARNADATVATDLTRVYRALGRDADAERVMSRIADRAADQGIDARRRTARTLIGQGQLQRAIEVLEMIADGQDVARDALLCSLYRRTGKADKAAALYKRLLADDRVEPAVVADGADFFAARDEPAEADKFLAKLRTMDVPTSTRELLLARHAERHGTPEAALKGYEAAVAADAAHPASWQGLVAFHLRRLQFAEAAEAADRGLKSIPDEPTLLSLRARAQALRSYQRDPNMDVLAAELSNDPQSGAITDMLRILGDAKTSNEPAAQTIAKLRELADRNPELLRLQLYVAQGHAKLGQFDDAERVAGRAAVAAPNDPDAARMLMAVYAARPGDEKWAKVLDAARQWRERSLDNPLPADVAIARTLLAMRRASEAVAQLKPHVPAPLKPDAENAAVVEVYAAALIRAGEERQAAELLAPVAKQSPAWRQAWLNLGVGAFDEPDGAAKWVEQVVPMLGDAPAEQVALAEAWCAIGGRFGHQPSLAHAKAVIEPLTANPQTSNDGWRLLARWSEAAGDMPQAARAYRKLLEVTPDNADVKNNLAYALLEQGKAEDLPEARTLAESAVAKSPASATYLDTLARVQLKAGDLPAAEQSFARALDSQKGSLEAMIGLADVYARTRRTDKVNEMLARINNALQPGENLSAPLQRQLEAVRQSVKAPVQSGRIE